jgi:hypothetical protein
MPNPCPIRLAPPLALALALAACGGAQTAPPAHAPPAHASPGQGEWKTWSHDEKLAYMKDVVLPAEAPWFRQYAPARFAELTCRSCHGAGADDGSYAMPNPALPKLAPGNIHDLEKTSPKAFAFMNEVVMPRTAQLLGQYPWAHATMSGFGCFGCHPVDRAAPRPATATTTTASLAVAGPDYAKRTSAIDPELRAKLVGRWTNPVDRVVVEITSVDAASGKLAGHVTPTTGPAAANDHELVGWVSGAPPRDGYDRVAPITFSTTLYEYGTLPSWAGFVRDDAIVTMSALVWPNRTYAWDHVSTFQETWTKVK